jgi:hypothetical protein
MKAWFYQKKKAFKLWLLLSMSVSEQAFYTDYVIEEVHKQLKRKAENPKDPSIDVMTSNRFALCRNHIKQKILKESYNA